MFSMHFRIPDEEAKSSSLVIGTTLQPRAANTRHSHLGTNMAEMVAAQLNTESHSHSRGRGTVGGRARRAQANLRSRRSDRIARWLKLLRK